MVDSVFSENKLHVFLDLEGVLVESVYNWTFNTNPEFLRCVEWLIEDSDMIELRLFSFAIHDAEDLLLHQTNLTETFNHFGLNVSEIIFKNDLIEVIKKVKNIQVLDSFDVSQLLGKEESFKCFCIHHNIRDSVLLDDTVNNSLIKIRPTLNSLDPAINKNKFEQSIQLLHIDFV